MEVSVNSYLHGFYVYQDVWIPIMGSTDIYDQSYFKNFHGLISQ